MMSENVKQEAETPRTIGEGTGKQQIRDDVVAIFIYLLSHILFVGEEQLSEYLGYGSEAPMNLASEGGDPKSNLIFVNFNQDCT